MTEKYPLGALPWQVATVDDINRLVEDGDTQRAIDWCEKKIFELNKILQDAKLAEGQARVVSPEEWNAEQEAVMVEIQQWKEILATLQQKE